VSAFAALPAEFQANLKDPHWRLRNLYRVRNKEGQDVQFKPWPEQERFLNQLHYRNIVPKARQRGISTLVQLLFLDTALFTQNWAVGVIAQDDDTAKEIFRDKIMFAYDRLPQLIRDALPTKKRTQSEVIFANNSSLVCDVSVRGTTKQCLHVSELGIIAKTDPERAYEIQTGSLPAVDKTGIVVIESTVESPFDMFSQMCKIARRKMLTGETLTPLDYKLFFTSWWDADEYTLDPDIVTVPREDDLYFDRMELEIRQPISPGHRAWWVTKRDAEFAGDSAKMFSQYPTTLDEAFKVNTEGLWLSKHMETARAQGRITDLPIRTDTPIMSVWDIGVGDDVAVWFFQLNGPWADFIGYYECNGEAYSYYTREIRELFPNCTFGRVFLPHDGAHRHPGSEQVKTVADMLEELGWRDIEIVPRTPSVDVGINQLREAFPTFRFDKTRCAVGIEHLEGFAKPWNNRLGMFMPHILKNGHQHAADAIRQWAQIRHDYTANRQRSRPKRSGARRSGRVT